MAFKSFTANFNVYFIIYQYTINTSHPVFAAIEASQELKCKYDSAQTMTIQAQNIKEKKARIEIKYLPPTNKLLAVTMNNSLEDKEEQPSSSALLSPRSLSASSGHWIH